MNTDTNEEANNEIANNEMILAQNEGANNENEGAKYDLELDRK